MRPEHRARCVDMLMGRGELAEAEADKLIDAGYQTARLLREATDKELLAVVEQAAVDKIRAWAGIR